MNKLITVIVPSYNMEQYIEKCCKSLLLPEKKMNLIEVLIINDGSTDKTSEVGHFFQSQYPEVFKIIDKKNGHYGSCVNEGLKLATGKYVKILDCDDTFDTAVFDSYVDILERCDSDLVITDFTMVDKDNKEIKTIHYPLETNIVQNTSALPSTLYKNFAMHAVTYKTELLKEIDYTQTEGIMYTDQEWIFYPMSNMNTFYYYNQSLYLYLTDRDGQSVDPTIHKKNLWMELIVTKKMIDDYKKYINKSKIQNQEYMKIKLLNRCMLMYQFYLVNYRNSVELNKLREFDLLLKKELSAVYYELNQISLSFFKFKYIKIWRKNYSTNTVLFQLFYIVIRFQSFVNFLIKKLKEK